MPPSGFNQKAVNGLLVFIREVYKITQQERNNQTKSEKEFLKQIVETKENILINTSSEGHIGLNTFIRECFKDLSKEIEVGKDVHGREVLEGQSIEKELKQIGKYLEKFTI